MRRILVALTIAIAIPSIALAARFDFSGARPAVMDDGESADSFEQTRFDWSGGAPVPVFDSTAVEDTPAASGPDTGGVIFF